MIPNGLDSPASLLISGANHRTSTVSNVSSIQRLLKWTVKMHVVIVGGSLVGLMHGIVLKHHGCDVDILEQTVERLEGQAAGVGTGLYVKQFLDRHDRLDSDFAFVSNGVRTLDAEDQVVSEFRIPMAMTSWDNLYYRLRANFDEHMSALYPEPPAKVKGDGRTTYHTGKKLVAVDNTSGDSKTVIVRYEDVRKGEMHTMSADLVIGADGANSSVRSLFSSATGRKYAGYVLWRGIIPQKCINSEAMTKYHDWFTFCPSPQRNENVVLYPIPGANGSLEADDRDINFAWYAHITQEELSEALVDVDGYRHQWSVPCGKLKPDVWKKQLQRLNVFDETSKEIGMKVDRPFLQVIGDHTAPKASFLDGKVLLVGDGLVTLRPHTGAGISSGAFHALQLEKALFERDASKEYKIAMQEWEKKVLDFSHVERLRSISWGEYYLGGWRGWIPAAIHYHGLLRLKAWQSWITTVVAPSLF